MNNIIPIFLFVICVVLVLRIKKLARFSIVNQFYAFFYLFELALASFMAVFFGDMTFAHSYSLTINETVVRFSIGVFIYIIAIYLGLAYYKNKQTNSTITSVSFNDMVATIHNRYNIGPLSFILAILFSVNLLTNVDLGYAGAVIRGTFSFSPIIIGLCWHLLKTSQKVIWVLLLLLNFLFLLAQGGRGSAIFPIVFFIIGYMISIYQNKELFKKRFRVVVICGLLGMPVMSAVGAYRDLVGRGNDVSLESILDMISFMSESSNRVSSEDATQHSLGRLLIGPNCVIPSLSPNTIPYRGWDSFSEELRSCFSLVGSEQAVDKFNDGRAEIGYGIGVPTKYGFYVTEANSVEFPLFADGYSRFGYLGLFIYSFLYTLLFCYLENKCKSMYSRNSLLAISLLLFVIYSGCIEYNFSYYSFLKRLLFKGIVVYFLFFFLSKFIKKNESPTYLSK